MGWDGFAPPGALAWALPTFFGAINFGARLGGAERRLGVEEFTWPLPVDRAIRYWSRFVLAAAAWIALSVGAYLLIYSPLWLRGNVHNDSYMLTVNQCAWVLGLSWIALASAFARFADWRPTMKLPILESSCRRWR